MKRNLRWKFEILIVKIWIFVGVCYHV